MQSVWLDYRDGQWGTRPLTEEEAASAREKGSTVVQVSARVWAAWEAHLAQGAVFDALWRSLDNEAYALRNEKV